MTADQENAVVHFFSSRVERAIHTLDNSDTNGLVMATREYLPLLSEAQLAFNAALQRLGRAQQALNDLLIESADNTPNLLQGY